MRSVMNSVEKILARVCAALMALMVVDVTWQVFSRFLLENPSSFSEELARFLLMWIGFLGAAYAYRRHAHLGLDILTANLTGYKKVCADRFADIVSFAFAAVIMVYAGTKIMMLTIELNQVSAALQIKIGYVYSVIPLSGLLICIFAIERLVIGRPQYEENTALD